MARDQKRYKAKFLETLSDTGIVMYACKKSGLPRSTFYKWVQEDDKFARAVKKATIEGSDNTTDLAVFGLVSLIKDKDLRAIMFWLNNRSENFTFPRRIPQRDPPTFVPIPILSTKINADGTPRVPSRKKRKPKP